MSMTRKQKLICTLSSIGAILSEIFVICISTMTGNAIDSATSGKFEGLFESCLLLILLTILNNCLFIFSVWLNQLLIKDVIVNTRELIARSLLRRRLSIFRKKEDAYYTNLILSDVANVGKNDFGLIPVEIKFISLFLCSIIAMMRIDLYLFIIAIIFSFVPMIVTRCFAKVNRKNTNVCSEMSELQHKEIIQFVQSYEMEKINCVKESAIVGRIKDIASKKTKCDMIKEVWECTSYMAIDVVDSLGQLILIGIGGYFVILGRITTGQLVTCTMLAQYVCSGINNYLEMHISRDGLKTIRKKIYNEITIGEEEKINSSLITGDKVKYENVSFSFNDACTRILDNVSYEFKKGKTYAIIGESGSGKSTFMKLLMGYYSNYSGKILIDGEDIKELQDKDIYQIVGYLNQNESILNASLKNNIAIYDEENIDEEKLNYLKNLLSLDELFIKIGNRKLGDCGDTISGGERQRIALARILYRNPKILILDEPLNGLDIDNQAILLDAFWKMNDKIRIMITHNTSDEFLNRFDHVIDLNKLQGSKDSCA